MGDFLSFIGRLFSLLWDYIVSFFENLLLALDIVGSSITQSLSIAGYLPAIFGASVSICVAVYVIKFLLGR